jgi:hypothetical protein
MDPGEQLLEAVTADTIAGEIGRASRHSLPIGTPCPNCRTAIAGPWCYACGQRAEKYDRSILHLIAEAFEGLTHLDGRVWTTLPKLLLRPGKLTREYLDGHRAVQIPPFRLFLVVLLAVFFAGSLNFGADPVKLNPVPTKSLVMKNPSDAADMQRAAAQMRATAKGRWLMERGAAALEHPEALSAAMERWAHQFAVLMLPIAALMLSVLFVFKKGVYVFDHLIFSMHSLSFQGLLLTAVFLGGLAIPGSSVLLLLSPIHLFVHMRGTYGISVIGTLIRMFLLSIGSLVAFSFLMVGLVFAGLASLH